MPRPVGGRPIYGALPRPGRGMPRPYASLPLVGARHASPCWWSAHLWCATPTRARHASPLRTLDFGPERSEATRTLTGTKVPRQYFLLAIAIAPPGPLQLVQST